MQKCRGHVYVFMVHVTLIIFVIVRVISGQETTVQFVTKKNLFTSHMQTSYFFFWKSWYSSLLGLFSTTKLLERGFGCTLELMFLQLLTESVSKWTKRVLEIVMCMWEKTLFPQGACLITGTWLGTTRWPSLWRMIWPLDLGSLEFTDSLP